MKVLFTCQPALGHLHPLIPLGQALTDAGHEVAFACAPAFCSTVKQQSFHCFPAGLDWLVSEAENSFPKMKNMSLMEQSRWFLTYVFANVTARAMLRDLLTTARRWSPDLIVRDCWEFGGYVAAEKLNIPHASAGLGTFFSLQALREFIGPQLKYLRRIAGLPLDPELETLYRYLYIHFAPPSYLPSQDTVPVAHAFRLSLFDRTGNEQLPAWIENLSDFPTVYGTLGTVVNKVPGIFESILNALQDEPVNLVLTIGRDQDPAQFGPRPSNVYIERYIPQTLLLPHCDVVISHGGYNTFMAALSHGLPQLVIPLGADQLFHAQKCTALNVGITLSGEQANPQAIKDAVRTLLENSMYLENANRIKEEILAMPGPEQAVELLEQLTIENRPIFR